MRWTSWMMWVFNQMGGCFSSGFETQAGWQLDIAGKMDKTNESFTILEIWKVDVKATIFLSKHHLQDFVATWAARNGHNITFRTKASQSRQSYILRLSGRKFMLISDLFLYFDLLSSRATQCIGITASLVLLATSTRAGRISSNLWHLFDNIECSVFRLTQSWVTSATESRQLAQNSFAFLKPTTCRKSELWHSFKSRVWLENTTLKIISYSYLN